MKMETNRRTFIHRAITACGVGLAACLTPTLALAETVARKLGQIKATVIQRFDPDYENYRVAMTASHRFRMPDRYPDAIVLVETLDDVTEALRYARSNKLKIAMRGTGHTAIQTCLRNGGLLLDLSRLNQIEVDPESQTAWVQPGARMIELLAASEPHGLAFPGAHGAAVGLGGFLLGGGIGWNTPNWGIACRSVLEAEVMTADGTLLQVSENHHPELLWALRGAGSGFFGVVTRFRIKLYPIPKAITASYYTFTEQQLPLLAETLEQLMPTKDPRIEALISLGFNKAFSPLTPEFSEEGIHCTVDLYAFSESDENNRQLMEIFANNPLFKEAGIKREHQARTYQDLYGFRDTQTNAARKRTNTDNMWMDRPKESFLDYIELFKQCPSPYSRVQLCWSMNIMGTVANTSFPNFADHYMYMVLTAKDEQEERANKGWMEKSNRLVQKYAKGHYINEAEYELFPERIPGCFTQDGWKQLGALRAKYDPQAVFHNFLGF